jgi:hypothetical protein
MNIIFEVEEKLAKNVIDYQRLKFNGKQYLTENVIQFADTSTCNKIYKRDIIEKYHIRMPEDMHFEDVYFNDCYWAVTRTMYFYHRALYNYVRHDDSIMSNTYKKSGIGSDHYFVMKPEYEFLREHNLVGRYNSFFWRRFSNSIAFAAEYSNRAKWKEVRADALSFLALHKEEIDVLPEDIKRHISQQTSWLKQLKVRTYLAFATIYNTVSLSKRYQDRVISNNKTIQDYATEIATIVQKIESVTTKTLSN